MFYYEVATAGNSRGATSVFTYESNNNLSIGTIVFVAVRKNNCLGFIVKKVTKPSFQTNAVDPYQPETILPIELIKSFDELRNLYPYSESKLAGIFTPPPAPKKYESSFAPSSTSLPLPPLNNAQHKVVQQITASQANSLLFGDTGTGKTRIYQHLINNVLSANKSVILLTPEIGLASYMQGEMLPFFPNSLLYHSNLSPKQRFETWLRSSQEDDARLVIGPRSALSLPIKNIGLIILDEAHDSSYRQEGAPYLHAKVLAALLAKYHGAQCVYGTATPSVVDYYYASVLKHPIVNIRAQAVEAGKLSIIKVVDYMDETEKNGSSILKSSLKALSNSVKQGGQSLVLINRRGTARYVACDNCGNEQRCKRCDHLVVYHHDSYELRCHFCNSRYPVPTQCSECGSHDIKMKSFGTKAIVEELSRIFPDVAIKRFDTDTSKKDHLEQHTSALKSGEIQMVVGTQMVAKGLDLPKLRTLVVLSGSSGSGFGGEERDFQLLYQVLGRAMRGHQDTEVIIQTSSPDANILTYAVNRDYAAFYEKELSQRKAFYYPPFCHMMIVHITRKSSKSALSAADRVVRNITLNHKGVVLSGPLPDMTERLGADYHWHLLVKSAKRSRLTDIALELGSGFVCELDPIDTP